MILIPCYIVPLTLIIDYIKDKKVCKIIVTIIFYLYTCLCLAFYARNIKRILKKSDTEIVNYVIEHTNEDDNVLILTNECYIYNCSNRKYNGKYFYQGPIINIDNKIYEEFLNEIEIDRPNLIIYPKTYKELEIEKKEDKNMSKLYKKIESMEKEKIYTKTVNDKYVVWNLMK